MTPNTEVAIPGNDEIKRRLQDMTKGMTRALAQRRAYCVECNKFVGDLYHHRQFFAGHKYIRLADLGALPPTDQPPRFTPRDEILRLAANAQNLHKQGVTGREIAQRLGITISKASYYTYGVKLPGNAATKKANIRKAAAAIKKHRKIISVLGSPVLDQAANNGASSDAEFHYGYFNGSLDFLLRSYAEEHGLELAALKTSVVNNLKKEK